MPSPRLPLAVSLIPIKGWNKNVRAIVAQDTWESMRYYFGAAKYRVPFFRSLDLPRPDDESPLLCAACGAEQEVLELHEHWEYDDKRLIQKLVDLMPLCANCHNVVHFGRACQLGLEEQAVEHLCRVNGWTLDEANAHVDDAYAVWGKRSIHTYSLNFDWLKSFLSEGQVHLDWLRRPKFWSGNRLDAIEWAKDRLASNEVVIVDTETTGLLTGKQKNDRVEVIELAIISMKGDVLYQSRFRPKYKIPKRTTAIHGISEEDVRHAPTFADEFSKISAVLAGKIAISYNDRFDSGVIAKTCVMYKLDPPDCRWECAMRMYRAFLKVPKFVRLPDATHGAAEDCQATLRLVCRMADG